MKYENLLLDKKDHILQITISRERKLNALNKETLSELHFALTDAMHDTDVHGLIVTGAGEKAFVAGADIREFQGLTGDEAHSLAREAQSKVFDYLENCSKPIIAAINGYALGGGLEIALACHIRIAASGARLGFPELTLGLIPGYGGTQRLTRLIGKGFAMQMILSSEMITAEDALSLRLVNEVVPADQLLPRAQELMLKIISNPPSALAAAIRAINASTGNADGFMSEMTEFGNCFDNNESKEGISAFLEKRKRRLR